VSRRTACEELLLGRCEGLQPASPRGGGAPAPCALEPALLRAHGLRALSLRGLAVGAAALRALAGAPGAAARLEAVDLAFCTGLPEEPTLLLQLVEACPRLARCNLRGAKTVSCDAYNAIGRELQARQQRGGRGESYLHSAFYYLKR